MPGSEQDKLAADARSVMFSRSTVHLAGTSSVEYSRRRAATVAARPKILVASRCNMLTQYAMLSTLRRIFIHDFTQNATERTRAYVA